MTRQLFAPPPHDLVMQAHEPDDCQRNNLECKGEHWACLRCDYAACLVVVTETDGDTRQRVLDVEVLTNGDEGADHTGVHRLIREALRSPEGEPQDPITAARARWLEIAAVPISTHARRALPWVLAALAIIVILWVSFLAGIGFAYVMEMRG